MHHHWGQLQHEPVDSEYYWVPSKWKLTKKRVEKHIAHRACLFVCVCVEHYSQPVAQYLHFYALGSCRGLPKSPVKPEPPHGYFNVCTTSHSSLWVWEMRIAEVQCSLALQACPSSSLTHTLCEGLGIELLWLATETPRARQYSVGKAERGWT